MSAKSKPDYGDMHATLGEVPESPTSEAVKAIKVSLIESFKDVFNSEDILRPMSGPPMTIQLQDNAEPFAIHGCRPVPFALRDKVQTQIRSRVDAQIIAPVMEPTVWCHPGWHMVGWGVTACICKAHRL